MRGWGKSGLSAEKIALVIASAINTLGEPCIEAERQFLMALAGELHHSRQQKQITKQALEAIVENDEALREMGRTVGKVTTAVLISLHLDPRRFATPKSYGCGSFGPNKTAMRSKGKFLKDLSKRPPSGM
jgi:hypothetical protein